FHPATTGASPGRIRVFAVATDHQRLTVDEHHPTATVELSQTPLHFREQLLDFGGVQATAHDRLRRQLPRPQVWRPIRRFTRPTGRSIVDDCPQVDSHDLPIEKTWLPRTTATRRVPAKACIMPTRVRVPCLVSLKKVYKTSMAANSLYFIP